MDFGEAWWCPVNRYFSIIQSKFFAKSLPSQYVLWWKAIHQPSGQPLHSTQLVPGEFVSKIKTCQIPTRLTIIHFRTSQGHHTRRRTLWRTWWIPVYCFYCQNYKLGSLEEHHLSGNLTLSKVSTHTSLIFYLLSSSTSRLVVKRLSKIVTNFWKRTLVKTELKRQVRLSLFIRSRLLAVITYWRSSRKLRVWEVKD